MQTYSHFIVTLFANRQLKKQEGTGETSGPRLASMALPPLRTKASLLGSIMPDIPLILIFFGFLAYDLMNGRTPGPEGNQSSVSYLFNDLFFNDPWLKAAHNVFHAPILVLCYIALGYWLWQRGRSWGPTIFWFGLACTVHTLIDIPLHFNDGPLLFFPFDWNTRFYSPVSYWDPARYGRPFAIFEHLLILGLVIYLIGDWWLGRRRAAMERLKMPM